MISHVVSAILAHIPGTPWWLKRHRRQDRLAWIRHIARHYPAE